MKLFQRLFFAAVFAGLAAGITAAAFQQWKVVPLILAAEVFETAEPAHEHATATEAAAPHEHKPETWAPGDGAERIAYTILASVLASLGFAMMLAALSAFTGIEISLMSGVVWGLGGFIAVSLAPSLGLPPELPGMPAADLGARQVWWWTTVTVTAAGLLAVAKLRTPLSIGVAAALILAPHVAGAPQLAGAHESAVPASLATAYASASLTAAAVSWLLLGPLLGYFSGWLATSPATRRAPA